MSTKSTTHPARAELRELGLILVEEARGGDRRMRQALSVSHHRKVERRQRRRRGQDRRSAERP